MAIKKEKIGTRGRTFVGTVVSSKMQNTVTISWDRKKFVKKYERYENKRSKIKAHNPENMNAEEGDVVKVMECRPISKTKNFTIIEIIGKEKGFVERMEAEDEAKVKKNVKKEIVEEKEEEK